MALTVELEKKLGDFRLEVSFTAGEGETLALLGVSGSGKSVTLRCIAGVERPDRGRVVLDGVTLLTAPPISTCRRKNAGWVISSRITRCFPI